MTSFKENFGKRIQEIRKSKGLTQEKLAELIGLDTPNLSNIERGKRFVSSSTLEKIIDSLQIEENELFDFNHLKTKEELTTSIKDILDNSSYEDIVYYYRMIKIYKEKN